MISFLDQCGKTPRILAPPFINTYRRTESSRQRGQRMREPISRAQDVRFHGVIDQN